MITSKDISIVNVLKWTAHHIVWLLALMASAAILYELNWIKIVLPWLPVSIIGTAVAFYVGFKNNQAYDRMWEARKIWGGIVNSSRTWGMYVDGFISNQFTPKNSSAHEIEIIKKRLVYRHIGWLYQLREQLLIPTPWEHISQKNHISKAAEYYQKNHGIGLIEDEKDRIEVSNFIPKEEYKRLMSHANSATHIINEQSRDLQKLKELGLIDDFRHLEMSRKLSEFYELQGKCERIKKFPLPRQYANISRYFIGIFILLLPFSMVPELLNLGPFGFWVAIPISALIGWVYVMMEVIGDYSENPFQGMANDIPMLSLCRTIEIDLREILGETNLPPAIKAKNNILM